MRRGLQAAVLLALASSLATVPGAGAGGSASCGLVVAQDDAGSGRDAGATADEAVALGEEGHYAASISYPRGPVLDAEDWFQASWEDDTERRVMVNVTTRVAGLGYMLGTEPPAPPVELEAYAPGAEEPTHEGEVGEDGVVRLNFTTDRPGTWTFRASVAGEPVDDCPTPDATVPRQAQTYNLYLGCHPHCLTVS